MKTLQGVLLGAVLACASLVATPAEAAPVPDRPITLVVPLAAGSTADILARSIQPGLSQQLGQTVVVENKPGGGGQIAMSYVAKATPDGYTLVLGSNNTWAINLGLFSKLSYDPTKDFVPVAYLAGGSNVLVVPSDSPYRSVPELVSALKAQPGKLMYSSGGNGTTHHLSAELLLSITGTQAAHIPYRGAPQGVAAVMAHEVAFAFYNTPSVSGLVKEGKLRALAVTGEARSPLLPDVPTMMEEGVPGYVITVDLGLMAPAGTPPDVVAKFNAAARKVMDSAEQRQRLQALGYEISHDGPPSGLAAFIQADIAKWVPLVQRSGAKVD
ncbi:Bug family tripartite tricarboxylate transporter substrate binding protein [Achromobacter aegrifaciens]|uniref:Bug family tripartite tricarboxylate transporter substrate binding protein n=1 Tax=Achromobacter aegrifaciens TaxID=1287736 RepID=UPI000F73E995|nr:tripartite tricarboxylate transporter substrate binding protein [Achromobacter aegrifaciens]RSE99887.1 tripartite tricarboxylate transporter substrate binding protein [Achromobacter aegrifaciens]